ncbi:MAG: hypothetical protein JNM99_24790 [Verrucomicrobiaceae bacterium]|nr:hypothetical protein [Verrucomicrobiaceae bacterium]
MNTTHRHSHLRLALVTGFAFILGSARAADFTSTWNGGSANWSLGANWTTPGAPGTSPNNGGSTYDAIQNGGTITLDQNITIQKFTLSGGILTGANTLTLNDTLSWSGGTMDTAGITNAYGGMTLSGGANKTILGRTVNNGDGTNAATATWTGGFIDLRSGGIFNNQTNAIFTTDFNGAIVSGSGASTFNNEGTFIKSGGTGPTTIGDGYSAIPVLFNNSGTAKVMTGFLNLGTGGTSTGTFDIDAGATLRFLGGTYNSSGIVTGVGGVMFSSAAAAATVNLTGTYSLTGAITANGGVGNITVTNATATSLTVESGSANINGGTLTAATLDLSGGSQGGTGTVNVTGATTWTGGRFSDAGSTSLLGGATLSGIATKEIFGRTVNNGDGTNAATATWTGGFIDLRDGGIFNNKANATFTTNFDGAIVSGLGASTFNNAGTFTKSGGTGITSISDPFSGIPVTFNNTGTVNADSGTLRIDRFNMQGGTVTGAGIVSATGSFNWSGGTFSGAGALNVSSTSGTITTAGAKGLDRTLNNTGTITYSSPVGSSIQFGVGTSTPGVINNSGTFNVTGNGNFEITNANAGHAITNSGTWNSTGSGNSTINTGIAFNNSGSVTVSGGRNFVVLGGGTHTGSFSVASGSTLSLIGSDTKLNSGSSITGAGNVVLGGGPGVTVNTGSTYNTTGNTSLAGGNATFNTSATTGSFTGGNNQSHLTVSGATNKLKVNGTFTNNTQYTTLEGGAIIETTAFNLNGGELNGNGSINGPLTSNGTIAPGASPGQITVNGNTILGAGSILSFEIGAGSPVTNYDVLTVNGTVMLDGELRLAMLSNFGSINPVDTFSILTSTSAISGLFANISPGQRLVSQDLLGSFIVNYGAGSAFGSNQVVLSSFINLTPEPSRAMLMIMGMTGVLMRRKRSNPIKPAA